MPDVLQASCNCGAVRLTMRGDPKRVGLCHCQTCRKSSGAAFGTVVVWDRRDVEVVGATTAWKESVYSRHFCPVCGSTVYGVEDEDDSEIDVAVGAIDEVPSPFTPTYELWVGRREGWLAPIPDAGQHTGNRPTHQGHETE